MFFRERVFWSDKDDLYLSNDLCLSVTVNPLSTPDDRYVCAKLRRLCNSAGKMQTIARIECRWSVSVLHIVYFCNECRRQLALFDSRNKFKNIGAWLLRRVILLLLPSCDVRTSTKIRLIADGVFLDEHKRVRLDRQKLVAYYKVLGFAIVGDDDHDIVMMASAQNILRKTKRLF